MKDGKKSHPKQSSKTPQREFGPADLNRALRALDRMFQEEPPPPDARFRRNRLIEEFAKHDVSQALAKALIRDLIRRRIFRRGSSLWHIRTFTPLQGEQVTDLFPDRYLHTTPRKWFDYINGALPRSQVIRKIPKRASRTAKIELIVRELRAFMGSAHELVIATREQPGGPKVLPRPTQKMLAALTGLTTSDVSRCLRDPSAKELKILWEAAADPNSILEGKDKRRRGKVA